MHELGSTRSANRRDHILQTPDTYVRAKLPGMKDCTAVVHIGPAAGAGFTEYTAEMEEGGQLGPANGQRFLYVLEGSLILGDGDCGPLKERGYAYLPAGDATKVSAETKSRVVGIEKDYQALYSLEAPRAF